MEIWKYPQVNPSQGQVSKYFFFYLKMSKISHLLFRCTEFTAVRRETEGDKKPSAWNTFLSDSTVLVQGPNSFLSWRTFISLHWNHFPHRKIPPHCVGTTYLMAGNISLEQQRVQAAPGESSSAHIPLSQYKAAQTQGLCDDASRVLRPNSIAILSSAQHPAYLASAHLGHQAEDRKFRPEVAALNKYSSSWTISFPVLFLCFYTEMIPV